MRARRFASTPVRSFALGLACSAMLISAPIGCGTATTQDDSANSMEPETTGPSLDQLHGDALQAYEPAPVVPDGPPSGSYSNYGIECTFPSFFRVAETPGLDFSVVTIENGDSKIVVTVYKDADASPAPYTKLKEVIERYYGGGTFPDATASANARNPLRDPHPETGMYFPDRQARKIIKDSGRDVRLYEGEDEWSRSLPRQDFPVNKLSSLPPSERDNPDGYAAERARDWGADEESDIFRRSEQIAVVKSNWQKFERPADTFKFEGLAGMGYFRGHRYRVMLETANVPASNGGNYMVHIVYIYPMTDEPIMRQVIATFQQSLKFTGNSGQGGAFPRNTDQPATGNFGGGNAG